MIEHATEAEMKRMSNAITLLEVDVTKWNKLNDEDQHSLDALLDGILYGFFTDEARVECERVEGKAK